MAFLPLKWPVYYTITLLRQIFPSNNPENRDPSYETDLDFGVDLKGESPAINMIKAEKNMAQNINFLSWTVAVKSIRKNSLFKEFRQNMTNEGKNKQKMASSKAREGWFSIAQYM